MQCCLLARSKRETFSKTIWNLIPATSVLYFFPPKMRHLTIKTTPAQSTWPHSKAVAFPEFTSQWHAAHTEHLASRMWWSARPFLPFREYCCPSEEVINGFIMYEKRHPSVGCLAWIAHISSSFMPSVLTVHRSDKTVPPFRFPLTLQKSEYCNYVIQRLKVTEEISSSSA